MGAYGALWVLPAHVVSLLINTLWYAELAELTIAAGQRQALVRRAERLGEGLSARRSPIKVRGLVGGWGWEAAGDMLYHAASQGFQ